MLLAPSSDLSDRGAPVATILLSLFENRELDATHLDGDGRELQEKPGHPGGLSAADSFTDEISDA